KGAIILGSLLIVIGFFFGLKPVYDSETAVGSFGDRVECGSAWFVSDDLTEFGETECGKAGLDTNRTLSFVLIAFGAVAASAGPSLFRQSANNKVAAPGPTQLSDDTRPCPYCAEDIKRAA